MYLAKGQPCFIYCRTLQDGTIICASYWSAWSARGAAIEQDKLLKDALDEIPESRHVGSGGVVDINTKSAILFVVVASWLCFTNLCHTGPSNLLGCSIVVTGGSRVLENHTLKCLSLDLSHTLHWQFCLSAWHLLLFGLFTAMFPLLG
ncbi:hypothetical protein J1N35_009983 [Gossypium stocksii]|uniref:Uncharacterized protein n=1 Tax=Gossypium stocksii TaxID=47602 RepID=A0A9D4AC65_9ROSI|nr:hypothetical protein J1N35_009983 [Gossypium stocksii]